MPRKYSRNKKRTRRRTRRKTRKRTRRRTRRKTRKRTRRTRKRKQKGGTTKTFYSDVPNVIELSRDDFSNTNIKHPKTLNKPGIVMMYADWCPHCSNPQTREMWSKLGSMVEKNSGWVGAMNCANEKNKSLSNELGIRGYPSILMVLPNGSISK